MHMACNADMDVYYRRIGRAFIPYSCGSAVQWMLKMISLLSTISLNNTVFHLVTLWLPADFAPTNLDHLLQSIPIPWRYNSAVYNSAAFGDSISAHRLCVHIYKSSCTHMLSATTPSSFHDVGFGQHIHAEYNTMDVCTIPVPNDILPPD